MDSGFLLAWVVDSSAVRFSLIAVVAICPARLFRFQICSATAPADSATVDFAVVDFDLCRRSCSATVAAGLVDSDRRRFVADLFSVLVAAAAAGESVFSSDVA